MLQKPLFFNQHYIHYETLIYTVVSLILSACPELVKGGDPRRKPRRGVFFNIPNLNLQTPHHYLNMLFIF